MTVQQGIGALVVLLPRVSDLLLVPAILVSVLLVFHRRTRSAAALSFLAIASLCVSFLSIAAASIVFVGWRFSHVAFELLVNLGPAATFDFLLSLLRVAGVRPVDFAPIIATAVGSAVAGSVLSRGGNRADGLHHGLDSLAPIESNAGVSV